MIFEHPPTILPPNHAIVLFRRNEISLVDLVDFQHEKKKGAVSSKHL